MDITHSHMKRQWRHFAQCVAVPDLPSTRTDPGWPLSQHIARVRGDHDSVSRPRRRKDSGCHQRCQTPMAAMPSFGKLDCLEDNIHLFNSPDVSL